MRTGISSFALCAFLALTACRETDLAPLRADLVSSAEVVCAPAPARPAPFGRTRTVETSEIEAALVKLCNEQATRAAGSPEALTVLHEGLAQDRALVGQLRRSRIMIDAARIELLAPRPRAEGPRSAEEALARQNVGCGPSWPGLDRMLLAAARADSEAGRHAAALERCADVIALARDEDLTGGLTDLLLANSHVQRAVEACIPIVDAAPKDEAAKLAASLTTQRATFPTSLDEVLRRDRAEMILFAFGKGRDTGRPLGCERANALAAASDAPLDRNDRVELDRAWREAKAENLKPDATYEEAYTLTLRVLDRLIEHAKPHP